MCASTDCRVSGAAGFVDCSGFTSLEVAVAVFGTAAAGETDAILVSALGRFISIPTTESECFLLFAYLIYW